MPSEVKGVYFLRLAICASRTEARDVDFAWETIKDVTDVVRQETRNGAAQIS